MAGPLASVTLAGLFALAGWTVAGPAGDLLAWLFVGNLVVRLQPPARVPPGRRAGGQGAGVAPHRAAPAGDQGDGPRRPGPGRRPVLGGAGAALWQWTPRWPPQVVLGLFLRAAADGERSAARRDASCSPGGPGAGSLMSMLVTARLRLPDRRVEVADVRRVSDLLARLEVLPGAVLVIRDGAPLTSQDELHDGDQVEVRFAISGGV